MTLSNADFGFDDRTFALLIAGRTIYEYAGLTMDQVSQLRQLGDDLYARTGLPVVIVPGGDLSADVAPADGPVYLRLAVGIVVSAADANAGKPLGPLTLENLASGARAAVRIPQTFWNEVAQIVDEGAKMSFTPAQLRASAPKVLEGIALDASEIREGPDQLFLVSCGRLPSADLVWGDLQTPRPTDDDSHDVGDSPFFLGQTSAQESHRLGVRGVRVVHANFAGVGAVLVDPDDAARIARQSPVSAGGFYLIPHYD